MRKLFWIVLRNAFVIALSTVAAAAADFTLSIGGGDQITNVGGTATVNVTAPGRATIPLVIRAGEFRGTVLISAGTTDQGTSVVTMDCPPEGGMECFFETIPVEVTGPEAVASVQVSPGPAANNGQVIFRATADGVEQVAILNVNIVRAPERAPAASVTVEPDAFELLPGEEKQVTVRVTGEKEWNGRVDVTAKGSNGTTVSEESFSLDTPGTHEITVKASPGAVPNRYAYVKIKVFPHGKNNLVSETNIRSEVKGTPAEFTISADPAQLELTPGGEPVYARVSLQRGSGWDGDVEVRIAGNDKVDVDPARARINSGGAYLNVKVRAKVDATPTEGSESALVVTASPVGGGPEREAFMGVLIRASEATLGSNSQLEALVASTIADNSHVEDLAAALSMEPRGIRADRADEQRALAAVYDSLISDLRNPAAMAARMLGDDPEQLAAIDPVALERLVAESGVLRRHAELRAAYQVASLNGTLPLFSVVLDGGDSVPSGLSSVRAGDKVNWSECKTPIEVVVQQMRVARKAKASSDWLGFTDAVLKSIESRWDVTNTDMTPWPHMQAAMKIEALIGSAISIADVIAKAIVAFMPNEITDFYTVVNNERHKKGQTPQIQHGQQVEIRAELVTGSPGGEIKSPMEIALMVCERVLKMKKISAKIEKLPSDRQRAAAEEMRKVADEIVRRVKASVAVTGQTPAVKAWAESPQGFWKVAPFKNPPVVLNSNRVLNLGSRSPLPLGVIETGDGTYALSGLNPARQAGYYFGLKKDLILDLSPVSKAPLVDTAVVDIVGLEPPPFERAQPCEWTGPGTWVKLKKWDPNRACMVVNGTCQC